MSSNLIQVSILFITKKFNYKFGVIMLSQLTHNSNDFFSLKEVVKISDKHSKLGYFYYSNISDNQDKIYLS